MKNRRFGGHDRAPELANIKARLDVHGDDLCTEPCQHIGSLEDGRRHLRVRVRGAIGFIDADSQALRAGIQFGHDIWQSFTPRKRVLRIESGNRLQHQCRVLDPTSNWTHVIERECERESAVLADGTKRRLDTDDTIDRGRESNRATSVSTQGPERETHCGGHRRSA